ncbi:hypothetical protein ACFSHR_24590 [Azotobacter chroococcum]
MKIRSPFPARSAGLPRHLRPFGMLGLTLLLVACAHQDYDHPPEPRPAPTQRPPVQRPPAQVPRQPSQTIKALPSSPRLPVRSRAGAATIRATRRRRMSTPTGTTAWGSTW